MKKTFILALALALAGAVQASDLTWKNWSGDLKVSTAANWEPEQVPAAGDNLTICWNGEGTVYVYNDLDIEYGHVTVAITNTTNSRIDIWQNELRVTDGFSFIGEGGTLYFRTSVTGTGEFLVNNIGGGVTLPVSPVSGRSYSGDFMLKHGSLDASAADVLGTEASHGKITIDATTSTPGYLSTGGTGWSVWNDIYYNNTTGRFCFYPSRDIPLRGDVYFTDGGGTLQGSGNWVPLHCYGKWQKWIPAGRSPQQNALNMFVQSPGIVFHAGYEDPYCAMVLYDNANTKVTIDCDVVLPYGILFGGSGTLVFARDLVSSDPLPLSMKNGSVVDLAGTVQKIGDITLASGATTASVKDSVGGGEMVWMPSADATLPAILSGDMSLTLATNFTGTIAGSLPISGTVKAATGTVVIASGAALPNVSCWYVAKDATLDIQSADLTDTGILRTEAGSTLTIAAGADLTVSKAFLNGSASTAPAGDYLYGDGYVHVVPIVTVWTGAAGDGDLANGANWSTGNVPSADDSVRFDSAAAPLSLNGSLTVGDIELTAGTTNVLASGAALKATTWTFGTGSRIESAGATVEIAGTGTYADVPVSKGVTLKVTGEVTFTSERIGEGYLKLEAADGDSVSVAQGVTVPVYTYKVGDAYAAIGTVEAGAGSVSVAMKPSDPADEWSVWTGGAGAENKSIFADANWDGGEAPDLTTGDAKLRFPAGSAVEIASGVARAYALDFQGACAMTGAGRLAVGKGGAAVAGAAVTFANPVEFTEVPQDWTLDTKDAKIVFNGALGASKGLPDDGKVCFLGNGDASVTKGIGFIEFAAKCADEMNAEVVVSNLVLSVRHGEALDSERGLEFWAKRYSYVSDPHMFKCGLTVEFPVCLYGFQREITDSTDQTAGNWVVFNKPMRFLQDPILGGDSGYIVNRRTIIFNAPVTFSGSNATIFNCSGGEDRGIWFNSTVSFSHRYYMSGVNSWVRFAKPGNTWEDVLALNDGSLNVEFLAANVLDSRKQILFYQATGHFEMNGYDQTIPSLWRNFNASAATTPTFGSTNRVAVLHLKSQSGDFPFAFTGYAGVEFLKSGNTVNWCNGTSKTRGPLIVTAGTVNFTASGKWYGSGTGAIRIASGAKVSAALADTFGDATEGYKTRFEIADGGTLELAADQTAWSLVYKGKFMAPGVYGKKGGGAQYEIDGITGDGRLTVTHWPRTGLLMTIR